MILPKVLPKFLEIRAQGIFLKCDSLERKYEPDFVITSPDCQTLSEIIIQKIRSNKRRELTFAIFGADKFPGIVDGILAELEQDSPVTATFWKIGPETELLADCFASPDYNVSLRIREFPTWNFLSPLIQSL